MAVTPTYKAPQDFKTLLPLHMQSQPAWAQFADAFSYVVQRNLVPARKFIERMEDNIKFRKGDYIWVQGEYFKILGVQHNNAEFPAAPIPERVFIQNASGSIYTINMFATQERQLLVNNAKDKGFEIVSEEFNDEDFSRIVASISDYYQYGGTDVYANLIGYIKNARFNLTKLWAEYDNTTTTIKNLNPMPLGDPIWDGGEWYPTNHVWFEYDLEVVGELPDAQLKELFFKVAPIFVVLDSFGGALYSKGAIYLICQAEDILSYELIEAMPLIEETPIPLFFITPTSVYESWQLISRVEVS